MKHKKVYEQPILKVIHIEISTLLTAGSSHNNGTLPSGMNNNRNIEFGTQIGEGHNKKRKLQVNITDQHRCKNLQQNTSKPNSTIH